MTVPVMRTGSDSDSTPPVGVRRAIGASAAAGGLSALVAAIAGLCCVGPLTVAVIGVGGAVAAASLKPYRLPLLAISLFLLAAAFWRTYRPVVTAAGSCSIVVGRATRVGLWVAVFVWGTGLVLYFVA